MSESQSESTRSKTGVLLINLGTPDGTGYWAVRRYLSEFLSDRRVVEMSPLFWQPLLQGIILTVRPHRSGQAYARIWDHETDESPLRRITREQADAVATKIGTDELIVDWAMRYGQPSIADRLNALRDKGCARILLVALYPQYSATTTASVYDKAFDALQKMRWQPAIRTLPPYYSEEIYIDALKTTLEAHLQALDWQPDSVLASFHGLPKRYAAAGDPYERHCEMTANLLRTAMGYSEDDFQMTFQSRFGPAAWLEPYTDDVLSDLAAAGKKNIVVTMPGFAADCLETLDEIANESRAHFIAAGGEKFSVVPCLNAGPEGIELLNSLITRELSGWHDGTE
ncbi:MAG TPA: ferrochelatase [Rhodospirillaceae bacterium]|nr:ferrochelatase [Rhodospirillaceae bacterium]